MLRIFKKAFFSKKLVKWLTVQVDIFEKVFLISGANDLQEFAAVENSISQENLKMACSMLFPNGLVDDEMSWFFLKFSIDSFILRGEEVLAHVQEQIQKYKKKYGNANLLIFEVLY